VLPESALTGENITIYNRKNIGNPEATIYPKHKKEAIPLILAL